MCARECGEKVGDRSSEVSQEVEGAWWNCDRTQGWARNEGSISIRFNECHRLRASTAVMPFLGRSRCENAGGFNARGLQSIRLLWSAGSTAFAGENTCRTLPVGAR